MKNKIYISRLINIVICTLVLCTSSIAQNLLDLPVKDLDGEVKSLREHIDPSSNYIIEAMAFWCAPCRRSMDDFTYHQAYWKERFNTEIIIIDDEHFDDIPYVENEMQEGEWALNLLLSDDAFSGFGINSYPTYYFIEAQSDSIYEINSGNERFLLEKVDSIFFNSIFEQDFQQTYLSNECTNAVRDIFDITASTINIGEQKYNRFGNLLLREKNLNGDLMLLDALTNEERVYIKYSAPLCTQQILTDREGDELKYKVLEKYQVDGTLHILTDRLLYDECTEDEKPFEIVQGIGTNAGLNFDIADNQVRSRLICHQILDESVYEDVELIDLCIPLSLEKENTNFDVSIVPNPSDDYFQIFMPVSGMKEIELYTISGQHIFSTHTNHDHIIISNDDLIKSESIILCKVITQEGSIIKRIFITK